MRITIAIIDHKHQRYETVGDWKWHPEWNDILEVFVSDLGDKKMNACIVIHELIEALLCRFNDPEITTEMVDEWDIDFLKTFPKEPEPGDCPDAPYHSQHKFASEIERAFAEKLGIVWNDYERRIKEL